MRKTKIAKIEFAPIPGVERGFKALSIRPPGTWFDSPDYVVFVGGCGVGHTTTLREAKVLLLTRAREACVRQMRDAEIVRAHYERELFKLNRDGLRPVKRKKETA